MPPVPRIFKLNGLSAVILAIAIAMGFYFVPDATHSAFVRWFVFPFSVAVTVGLLLVPACWLGDKLAQCLMGRLPPDSFKDAELIRFDRPPNEDSENRKE